MTWFSDFMKHTFQKLCNSNYLIFSVGDHFGLQLTVASLEFENFNPILSKSGPQS
jgi:hypothetical protein